MEREAVLEELRRVARELDTDRLSRKLFFSTTTIRPRDLENHFDRWNDAVQAAGLTPALHAWIDDETLFREMAAAFIRCGGICSKRRFWRSAMHCTETYKRRWGSWMEALAAFRVWLERTGTEFPFTEQLASIVASGRVPDPEETDAATGEPAGKSRVRERCGALLAFRGHAFEPVSEQGVVLLFGTVLAELGFVIEVARIGYPDCQARRRVPGRDDVCEHVAIEFEYRSSGFRKGGHDPAECDLVVCWIHDWATCPVEVLELRSAIQALSR